MYHTNLDTVAHAFLLDVTFVVRHGRTIVRLRVRSQSTLVVMTFVFVSAGVRRLPRLLLLDLLEVLLARRRRRAEETVGTVQELSRARVAHSV